ncbi:MAG: MFS transporter, partial [Hyphomicrobiales bacterium]|nr:MFS transporter [Hyphomicrobiales bacterium]
MRWFESRWWVLLASFLGLAVGAGTVYLSAFGLFLKPVTEDLGIGRGVFSFALALVTVSQAIGCAFIGRLIVRYGLRRVMIPGLVLYAGSIGALATLTPSLPYIYALFAVAGLVAAFGSPVGYGSAVVAWFDRDRGLALGLSIAGAGLGAVLAPPFVQFFISNYGWRAAYVALAAAVLAVALVPVAAFLREPPKSYGATGAAFARELAGLSAKEAFRSGLFWAFIIAFGTGAIAVLGALAHAFPYLTDKGVPKTAAVTALAVSGTAVTIGRLIGGFCLDRLWGPYVAAFFYLFPMVGIALLIFGGADPLILSVGVCLIGMGFGAEID